VAYLKNATKERLLVTKAFGISFVITAYVGAGTLFGLPPMKQVLQLAKTIKIQYVKTYGSPPYGRAELYPLKKIAGYMGWDIKKSLASLRKNGIRVESANQSIRDISQNNGISTSTVFENMRKYEKTNIKGDKK
jgi:hypothetical protein